MRVRITDLAVVDCHGHIFPPLAGACGFPSAEEHLVHLQRSMHVHGNQPYRRLRDHAVTTERPLWRADDPSEAGRAKDVRFRVGRQGRFEWERDGEGYYVQFLPPHMDDLSAPPERMIVEMDYAGVATVVLQNDHIYGNLGEYFAEAARRWPGRFVGLAQVDEPFGYRDAELRTLEDQVRRLGMRGLYFTMTAFFRNGYRLLPDDPAFDPLWQAVARLGLPVFWVHSATSPAGDYLDEMRRLRRIVERHPAIRHVLVHGVPDRALRGRPGPDRLARGDRRAARLLPGVDGGAVPDRVGRADAVSLRAGPAPLPPDVRAVRRRQARLGLATCPTSAATAPIARR